MVTHAVAPHWCILITLYTSHSAAYSDGRYIRGGNAKHAPASQSHALVSSALSATHAATIPAGLLHGISWPLLYGSRKTRQAS